MERADMARTAEAADPAGPGPGTAAGADAAVEAEADAFIELDGVEKVFDVRRKTGFLKRERRQVRAVDGLSFTVSRGEMVGYIGPNGAGKSTTIKMLTGILTPSGGRLRVAGIDPSRERIRLAHRIGVVFGQRTTLWWDLPLIDSYRLMHRMYRIPGIDLTTLGAHGRRRAYRPAFRFGPLSPPPFITMRHRQLRAVRWSLDYQRSHTVCSGQASFTRLAH